MTELAGHLLGRPLAHGPRGQSWIGRDRRSSCEAVVRRIPGGADAAARLRHDLQIVAAATRGRSRLITDVVVVDDDLVIVAPWFERSLAESIGRAERRSSPAVVDDLAALACELAALHARTIVHGAVTPANVLFDAEDRPVLADAGIGPALHADDGELDSEVGERTDVASLGAVALAMLSGEVAPPPEVAALEVVPGCPESLAALLDDARHGRLDAAALADRAAHIEPAGRRVEIDRTEAIDPPVRVTAHSWRAAVVGVAAATMLVIGGLLVGSRSTGVPLRSPEPAALQLPPCEDDDPPIDGDEQVAWGDLDGRGCLDAVLWSPRRAEAEVLSGSAAGRYALGRPGDVLALGDFDGDGRATPALYRPATGEVFLWRGWATDREAAVSVVASASGVIDGRAVVVDVVVDDDDRHHLVISPGP